jgi:hypothetical protein
MAFILHLQNSMISGWTAPLWLGRTIVAGPHPTPGHLVAGACRAISKRLDIARYPNKNNIQTFTHKYLTICILPVKRFG